MSKLNTKITENRLGSYFLIHYISFIKFPRTIFCRKAKLVLDLSFLCIARGNFSRFCHKIFFTRNQILIFVDLNSGSDNPNKVVAQLHWPAAIFSAIFAIFSEGGLFICLLLAEEKQATKCARTYFFLF